MGDLVSAEVQDGIGMVRLERPQAHNALTMAMTRELRGVLADVGVDPAVRVVLLAGEGRSFCAGLDLKDAMNGDEAPVDAIGWMKLQELYAGLMLQIRQLKQPVVAAVQGAAVGAGFGIALAADVRIAATSAAFAVGAVKIGLSGGECGISYHLPRLIGAGRAFEIMLTGRTVEGAEAQAIGLATGLVAPEDVFGEALRVAGAIAANAPYASKHTKQIMWANLEAASFEAAVELENHVQVVGLLTEDFREGARAFAEKRPPVFTGN